jgi:hypothetical protein
MNFGAIGFIVDFVSRNSGNNLRYEASAYSHFGRADYLKAADRACVCEVTSTSFATVSFTVTEDLMGKIPELLVLKNEEDFQKFAPKSKWLLVSVPTGEKGTVGWSPEGGDCEWVPVPAIKKDGVIYFQDWTANLTAGSGTTFEVLDEAPDGTRGLTLAHVKKLLLRPSKKSG